MDLTTALASKLEIKIVSQNMRVWFFRTKAGRFYYDFKRNGFIALGWDLVSPELITTTKKNKEAKKEIIEELYPDEKRPGLIFGQLDVFYNSMHTGDLVVIPSKGTKRIAIGEIGEVLTQVKRTKDFVDYPHCKFAHKRSVKWLDSVEAWQDIYLFKALRAQQTISDITEESKLLLRNLYPVYILDNKIHLTLQKSSNDNLSLTSNLDLLLGIREIADATAQLYEKENFSDQIDIKTAVGSPGILEIIFYYGPAAVILAKFLYYLIGKKTDANGNTSTGLLAIIEEVRSIVNDHHDNKLKDAQVRQLDSTTALTPSQEDKLKAETQEILSRARLNNANAQKIETENEQIIILPSGITSEELRQENNKLIIPSDSTVNDFIKIAEKSGKKIRKAAKKGGFSYNQGKTG